MSRRGWVPIGAALLVAGLLITGSIVRARIGAGLQPLGPGEDRIVHVPRGATVPAICELLQREGVIRDARVFLYGLKRWGLETKLKAGYYRLAPSMSPEEIARKVASGQVATVRVTVPEGFTLAQIAQRVAETRLCSADEFVAAATRGALRKRGFHPKKAGFDIPTATLEGYLYPETYRLQYGWDAGQIVDGMLAQFRKSVVERWAEELKRRHKPLHTIITVASRSTSEAKIDKDRPLIASVIYNRLNRDMRLQIDATVLYAQDRHKDRVLYSDLLVDSPYNTYRYKGLPPGPIASPGRASIQAALRPALTDYLYYVARKDGGHVFTRTAEEHEAAKRLVRGEASELLPAGREPASPAAGR